MLILCTARPELLERRPAWGGGKLNAANIALAPLSATRRPADRVAERAPFDRRRGAGGAARAAGGNPLYAEQYVRMLAERGTVGLAVPETVQGIIAARLDGLAPEEKALLQDAAVIGKVFWLGALGVDERACRLLEQKELVQRARRQLRRRRDRVRVRARARARRRVRADPACAACEKHLRAAEWIESLGRAEDHAEMVAHHYATRSS